MTRPAVDAIRYAWDAMHPAHAMPPDLAPIHYGAGKTARAHQVCKPRRAVKKARRS